MFENILAAGVKDLTYFSKGSRGLIYTGFLNKKKVVIKIKNPKSEAAGRMLNEARWLKILNKKGIGPKLLFSDEDYFCYEFVEGELILDFVQHHPKQEIISVLKEIFRQTYVLDKLQVDKEEMHRPIKHILVGKNVVMLDFERCSSTETPRNTTQFCQFLTSGKMVPLLKQKKIAVDPDKIRDAARKYKSGYSLKDLKRIIACIR